MDTLIILIPGNPSIPGLYERFLGTVVARMPGAHGVALIHSGQNGHPGEPATDLRQTVDAHRDSIRQLVAKHNPLRLYIVGHSLGTSIAAVLYPEFAHVITKMVMVCPFVGPTVFNNTAALRALALPVAAPGFEWTLRCIESTPPILRHAIFRRIGFGNRHDTVVAHLSTPSFLRNFITLAGNYIHYFGNTDVVGAFAQLPADHSLFITAPNDFWVPDEAQRRLSAAIHWAHCPTIKHAFCLYDDQSDVVADIASQFLA